MSSWDDLYGVHLDFGKVSKRDMVYSPDKKLAAACYESRRREDMYDIDILFTITIWDVKTKEEVISYYKNHNSNAMMRREQGKMVFAVEFDKTSKYLYIIYDDGSRDKIEIPLIT